jgi:4-hydroxy-tetrahydrodipicolinate synthase
VNRESDSGPPSGDATGRQEQLQGRLNTVREVFSSRKFPSVIAAIKQAIAIYTNDPEWARVRPPLIELTTEQAKLLGAELQRIGFVMGTRERG